MRFSRIKFRSIAGVLLLVFSIWILFFRSSSESAGFFQRWFDRPLLRITAPFSNGYRLIHGKIFQGVYRYLFLVGVEKENESLKEKLTALELRASLTNEVLSENRRLQEMLDLRDRWAGPQMTGLVARVVSFPPIGPYRILTIDKGSHNGINPRDAVIGVEGLVGQILRVSGKYSQVLLLTDPTSAVDARIDGSNARGLIVGKVKKLYLNREFFIGAFEYLNQSAEISDQARVITSGMDGIFPPGIPVGTVFSKQKKEYSIFQQAEVVPAVNFYKLQEVLVLHQAP